MDICMKTCFLEIIHIFIDELSQTYRLFKALAALFFKNTVFYQLEYEKLTNYWISYGFNLLFQRFHILSPFSLI